MPLVELTFDEIKYLINILPVEFGNTPSPSLSYKLYKALEHHPFVPKQDLYNSKITYFDRCKYCGLSCDNPRHFDFGGCGMGFS